MINIDLVDKTINVAFFGTSDRSTPILESLHKNFNLQFCVTKNDVIFGRKKTSKETGVKSWARQNSINFYEIADFNTATKTKICEHIISSKIHLAVVADFSFMIPGEIFDLPPNGTINIHFSLLPKYRGASPVQFAILNGESKTGVTFYKLDKGMDTGKIIYQFEHEISDKDTSGHLYDVLFEKAADELPSVIKRYLKGELIPYEQDNTAASYTYSSSHQKNTFIYKEDAQIDWSKTPQEIEREIRAYYSWPVSWTSLHDMQTHAEKIYGMSKIKSNKDTNLVVKIIGAEITHKKNADSNEKGTDKNAKLKINKLQVEGKNIIDWNSFKNGYLEN